MRGVQFDQIGRCAGTDAGLREAQRLRGTHASLIVEPAPARDRPLRQDIARLQRQALAVLEQAQFFGCIDQHIRIRTHSKTPARSSKGLHREHAIAQVRFR